MNIAPSNETAWYVQYWNAQRNLFVVLVIALITSNLVVAAAVCWLARILSRK